MSLSWTVEQTWMGSKLAVLKLFGKAFEFHWHGNDKRRQGSRAFLSIGWEKGNDHYGVLLQHYREGFDFAKHTDGPKSNKCITLLLHKPKKGGEFFCEGPVRVWAGRVIAFNGADKHGVSKVERGSRTILMFQHAELK